GFLGFSRREWWQWHSRAARFAQANSDYLLGRSGAVFTTPYMLDFFVNKFARRGSGRPAFPNILFCTLHSCFSRHGLLLLACSWYLADLLRMPRAREGMSQDACFATTAILPGSGITENHRCL